MMIVARFSIVIGCISVYYSSRFIALNGLAHTSKMIYILYTFVHIFYMTIYIYANATVMDSKLSHSADSIATGKVTINTILNEYWGIECETSVSEERENNTERENMSIVWKCSREKLNTAKINSIPIEYCRGKWKKYT